VAKLRNWELAFTVFQPPLGYEIRDLTITVGDDVAFGPSFNRLSGTLENRDGIGPWVRYTTGFWKIDGNCLSRTIRSRCLPILRAAGRC
jgi:ketosteroid isomerase-like protein